MGDQSKAKAQLAEEFMSMFNAKKSELSSSIEAMSPDTDVGEKLNEILSQIQQLSKSLHDAILYLPSYSVKMRQNEIRDLEKELKDKEESLIPKKKFGFKSKPKPVPISNSESIVPKAEQPAPEIIQDGDSDSNFVTIENFSDTTKVYGDEEISKTDVLVRNLSNVVLHLLGSPSTLRISNVVNCKILCGPVHTSVFVQSASSSVLFLCAQQLRTHGSEDTDIYLRVSSRAIIEDCRGLRFAPYVWDHPSSAKLHEGAGISQDLERFDAVDDFNWLSSTHSPNWSILPEEERISFPALK